MSEEGPEVYLEGARVGDEGDDAGRHGVQISDEVIERCGWSVGEYYFTSISQDKSNDDIVRIEVSELPDGISEDHPQVYKLRFEDSNYFIRFRPEWSSAGGEGLLFDVETEDPLVLEVEDLPNGDSSVLVYRREDYHARNTALVEEERPPIFKTILSYFTLEGEDAVDLSGAYFGDRFRIVPYDIEDPDLVEELKSRGVEKTYGKIPEEVFSDLIRSYDLPRIEADELVIVRYPNVQGLTPDDRGTLAYQDESVSELDVILPRKGHFRIAAEGRSTKSGQTSSKTLGMHPTSKVWFEDGLWVGGGWEGNYIDNSVSPPVVYVATVSKNVWTGGKAGRADNHDQ